MEESTREGSRIANNRLAVAVVVGSLCAAVAIWALFQAGVVDEVVPGRGPAADAVPLYLLVGVLVIGLVLWSWQRFLSFFE